MQTLPFDGRILVLGCGGVARCTLPLLLRHLDMPADRITVVDMQDHRDHVADALEQGVRFVQDRLTRPNHRERLARWLGPGDILLDFAWNVETADLLDWCRAHDVRYLNTCVEEWDPYDGADEKPTVALTLYDRQMEILDRARRWPASPSPSACLDHGANPGLVSHLVKVALRDIALLLAEEKPRDARLPALREALDAGAWNRVAMLLGVKVIHVSERDTQVTRIPKQLNEFVNTWSVEGFFEEGIAPAEIGWGTHERRLPPDARLFERGPRNSICLARKGFNTLVRSWVPCGEIIGMVIRHGEAFSISDRLTVHRPDGSPLYRPTVHYAYCPSDSAIASLHEMRMRGYTLQDQTRLMNDDVIAGRDELGCLLMGHDFKSWWIGSLLDIEETRRLVPGQNPTTLQVAASALGAVFWMIRHPHEGLRLPDDLPHEEILEVARPYLGPLLSMPVDWSPRQHKDVAAAVTPTQHPGDQDDWQFDHFLVVA